MAPKISKKWLESVRNGLRVPVSVPKTPFSTKVARDMMAPLFAWEELKKGPMLTSEEAIEETLRWGGLGVLKRMLPSKASELRQIMKEEFRARGPRYIPSEESILSRGPGKLAKAVNELKDWFEKSLWQHPSKGSTDYLQLQDEQEALLGYKGPITWEGLENRFGGYLRAMAQSGKLEPSTEHIKSLIDKVVRGSWFHGRQTYPKAGARFDPERIKQWKLGEPFGLSLTAKPSVLQGSFAKPPKWNYKVRTRFMDEVLPRLDYRVDKAWNKIKNNPLWNEWNKLNDPQLSNFYDKHPEFAGELGKAYALQSKIEQLENLPALEKKIARVLPLLGGPPSEKVLPVWTSPETKWAREIMQETYREALKKQPRVWEGGSPTTGYLRPSWRDRYFLDVFQHEKDQAKALRDLGYEALLYSPGRYNEYELRVLDPTKALRLDMRKLSEPGVKRLEQAQQPRLREWEKLTREAKPNLRHIYRDMELPLRPGTVATNIPNLAEEFGDEELIDLVPWEDKLDKMVLEDLFKE